LDGTQRSGAHHPDTVVDQAATRENRPQNLWVPRCRERRAPICSSAPCSRARRSAPVGHSEAPSAMTRRSDPSAPRSPATNFTIDHAESAWPSDSTMTVLVVSPRSVGKTGRRRAPRTLTLCKLDRCYGQPRWAISVP
jgi:hypothetical protein